MNVTERDRRLLDHLDGTSPPSERDRVEAWLAGDAAVRARYEELRRLFASMSSPGLVDPPADLRERVLDEIRARGAHRPVAHAAARHSGWLARRPRAVAAMAFAAGLAAGVLAGLGLWSGRDAPDSRSVVGAIGTPLGPAAVTVRIEGASMTGRAWRAGGECRVAIELALPGEVTAELLDPTGARVPIAVASAPGNPGAVRLEDGRVVWSGGAAGRFDVRFTSDAAARGPLRMSLVSPASTSTGELPVEHGPAR